MLGEIFGAQPEIAAQRARRALIGAGIDRRQVQNREGYHPRLQFSYDGGHTAAP
jgi:hypothetical protein